MNDKNAVSKRRVFGFGTLIAQCPHSCTLLVGWRVDDLPEVDNFKGVVVTVRAICMRTAPGLKS